MKLVKFVAQSYLLLLNSFLFEGTFSVFLKKSQQLFFQMTRKSLFSANKLYYVVFLSFFYIQLFPTFSIVQVFSGSRFFRVQVFQGPGFLGSRFFRVRVQGFGPGFRSSLFSEHLFLTTPLNGCF